MINTKLATSDVCVYNFYPRWNYDDIKIQMQKGKAREMTAELVTNTSGYLWDRGSIYSDWRDTHYFYSLKKEDSVHLVVLPDYWYFSFKFKAWLNYFPNEDTTSLQWTLFGSITGGIIVIFILRTFKH